MPEQKLSQVIVNSFVAAHNTKLDIWNQPVCSLPHVTIIQTFLQYPDCVRSLLPSSSSSYPVVFVSPHSKYQIASPDVVRNMLANFDALIR